MEAISLEIICINTNETNISFSYTDQNDTHQRTDVNKFDEI